MSLSVLYTRAQKALISEIVRVETHISNELPARKITVNLSPADLLEEGGRYDLSIALGVLIASGQLQSKEINNYEFIGELALTGYLRAIRLWLP